MTILAVVFGGLSLALGIIVLRVGLTSAVREQVKAFREHRGLFFFGGLWGFNRRRFGRASPWYEQMKAHGSSIMHLKVLREFMKAWEKGDLDEIRHGYMITNFAAYSGFVQGAVDCMGKECHESRHWGYLVTGLALPVVQWFNYGRTPPQLFRDLKIPQHVRQNPISHFRYAMENWDGYTQFLRTFIRDSANEADTHNVRMYRYIICFDESVVKAAEKGYINQPAELAKERSRENTISQLNAWILCDKGGIPAPIKLADTIDIIRDQLWENGTANPWVGFYSPWGDREERSHIIVPHNGALVIRESGRPANPNEGYQWCMVKEVFAELYQDKPRHLFVSTLDLDAVTQYYDIDEDAIPEDFFLIGRKDEEFALTELFSATSTVDWTFCLSAVDADEKLDKLELHFISSRGHRHPKVASLGSIIHFIGAKINAEPSVRKDKRVLGCQVALDL